jgi:hypothetical protein
VALVIANPCATAIADELPAVSDRQPVAIPHFPDAQHAIVWRNWQLVEPVRLAKVLDTNVENVTEMAVSMGLPPTVQVPSDMNERGYITILRRNWHLLPYEQLLQLLDMPADELAFRLREDDFLYIKLGSLKPNCPQIKYQEPNAEARQRAEEIRQLVRGHFGGALERSAEPRFGFIDSFDRPNQRPAVAASRDQAEGRPRFIYSYFAMFGDPLLNPDLDSYPGNLLAELHAHGVNGIWLHTVLRQLSPGGETFPEFGEGHQVRLENLRTLVDRARQHGIGVYLYVNEPRAMPNAFFDKRADMAGVKGGEFTAMCTSDIRVRRWISDSLAYVFEQVPGLAGVFTITASENLTNCASHGQQASCPRCAKRSEAEIVAEVNSAIEEGVHRSAPDAKVIAYDWGWYGNRDARETIARMPDSTWVMSVSEWSLPIERGGIKSAVGEYSISAVGPGPRATLHWKAAKERGLKTVAKVQLNNSWELSTVPYLPVLNLVAEHCRRLASADVDGMMLSWSLGGYPSANLEVAQQFAAEASPDASTILNSIAQRRFGPRAAPHVLRAWTKFSRAFEEFPYSGEVLYHGPQQMGPAGLLYGQPTGYAATMVGFPYDDIDRWRGPYPPQVLADQFQKVADGWAEGLVDLQAAQSLVSAELRPAAAADLRVAQAAQLHFASAANQIRFVLARNALTTARGEEAEAFRLAQLKTLDQEIELARRLFELASADSRLGYEASNHYFFVPLDLVEKVICCLDIRNQIVARQSDPNSDQ